MSRPSEHDYMASLPELPVDHPKKTHPPIGDNSRSQDLDLNLGATELRLGLPSSKPPPPERDFLAHDVEVSYTLGNFPKNFASGAKRGFSDAIDLRRSGNWGLADGLGRDHSNSTSQTAPNGPGSGSRALVKSTEALRTEKRAQNSGAQVVGWPPIRSFRKNTMATASPPNKTNNVEKKVEPKQEAAGGCLYVKVSMDGAPYLRKVNLKIYSSYSEISTALEKMFSCFTLGQYGYHGVAGRDGGLSESRLIDLLRGSDYVLTYEDKDGDWMLVGDVPWNMFTSSCRRLRITKSSEAVGLAKDKSKNEE